MVNNPRPLGKSSRSEPAKPDLNQRQTSSVQRLGSQRSLGVEIAQEGNKLVGPGNAELLVGPLPIGDDARSLDIELKRRSFDGLAGHRPGAHLALARAELR